MRMPLGTAGLTEAAWATAVSIVGAWDPDASTGGGFGHHPFIAPHRFGHIDHFHGGIFFDVPPLWVSPAPYVEVTPVPPPVWYYCTNPPGYYPTVPSCTVPWTPVYPPA